MITNNFRNLSKCLLAKSSINKGLLPCKDVNGTTYYISNLYQSNSYPYTQTQAFTLSSTSAGVSLGIGTTQPSAADYNLESTITSGLSVGIFNVSTGMDENDGVFVKYEMIVNNTSSSPITVREVGIKQPIYAATSQGGSSSANRICLIDRSLFDQPLTIAAGEYALVTYILKTSE